MTDEKFFTEYRKNSQLVIDELFSALEHVDKNALKRFAEDVLKANRVFFIGVGRVMLSLQAMAKRFSHLGIQTVCVGDITEPAITAEDVLVVGSGSGASIVPLAIAKRATELGAKVVHIGSNPNSEMKQYAEYMVRIPVRTRLYLEDEIDSRQIMTSLFEQSLLLIGDILSMIIASEYDLNLEQLWEFHANLE